MKKIILLLLLTCGSLFSQNQNTLKKFKQSELNEDLDSLRSYIIQTHPNPFSVLSKSEFENKIKEIKAMFRDGMTLHEYYKLINPMVASISDGHTSLKYAGNKFLQDDTNLFPYIAKLSIKEPYIVIKDYVYETPGSIPNSAEIISINEILAEKIIEKIIKNTSGESNEYRLKTASTIFLGSLLNTYFDFKENFTVKYKFKNKTYKKVIPAITFSNFKKVVQLKKQPKVENIPNYSLKIYNDKKTALLDFRYFTNEEAFNVFLDSTFRKIKTDKIENLIIDIRENGGGNSILGDALFRYIAKENFTQFSKTIIKYSPLQKEYYKENCDQDSTYCDTYNYMKSQENNTIETLENKKYTTPNENTFSGKVFLLTSLKTFSSASSFAQCFKHYKMGKIIGEETGGWILSYGDKITTTLPLTELTLSISQKQFYTIGATDSDTHGVLPDIKIKSEDALEYTLKTL